MGGLNPSAWPRPWQIIRSLRRAVTAGFFCRSEPAALLRGLANGGLPSSTRLALSASKSASRKNTSPRTSSTVGTGYSSLAGEPLRDVVDGAGVERDVLAGAPVAAGGRADQPAVAVDQSQRDAVDLQLAQEVHVRPDLGAQPGGPGRELVGVEHVVQATASARDGRRR